MVKSFLRFSLITALIAASLIALVPTPSAEAAAPYFFRYNTITDVVCSTTIVTVAYLEAEWVAPPAGQIDMWIENYVNGALESSAGSIATGSGLAGGNGDIVLAAAQTYPYNIELRYDSYVNGELPYRSTIFIFCDADGPATDAYIVNTDFTLGGGEVAEPVAVPGCDVLIDIPSTAVVGAFVSDASLYWEPGSLVSPQTVLEAGKTAWVLGVDASGSYTKILWGCTYVWVPTSSIGPNYDAVWNGTPLPTGVVE